MAETEATRSREFDRIKLLEELHGLVSSSRVHPIIDTVWQATGSITELRELLEILIQTRPQVRRVLERVLEIEGKLVTSSRVIT